MSVPVWKRGESRTDFLYDAYQLSIRLVEITANKPKKYKGNLSDQIIKTSLEALKFLQTANSIYITKDSPLCDFEMRRKYLLVGKAYIENLATIFYIFIETVRKHDSENDDKLYKQEQEIGDLCNEAVKRIDGLIKSDKEIYNKYIKGKSL